MRGKILSIREKSGAKSENLLCELEVMKSKGVTISYLGNEVELNRRFTDMIVRDGPCTYMRSYSFDTSGRIMDISFERVKL